MRKLRVSTLVRLEALRTSGDGTLCPSLKLRVFLRSSEPSDFRRSLAARDAQVIAGRRAQARSRP
jgi:hypothetical protein